MEEGGAECTDDVFQLLHILGSVSLEHFIQQKLEHLFTKVSMFIDVLRRKQWRATDNGFCIHTFVDNNLNRLNGR